MTAFSQTIQDFWRSPRPDGRVLYQDDPFVVVAEPHVREDRRITVLKSADGKVTATVTPAVAERLDLPRGQFSESAFRQAVADAGITLHDADCLFYFSELEKAALLNESTPSSVRQLTVADEAVFAEFQSSASEQDLDDAYVELDHWTVFGSFNGEQLVSATSAYPWDDAQIADLGVLTLPQFRGQGHARRAVRAISRHAYGLGYDPQYRCQLDNQPSRALAASTGLTLFGEWEVISPDSSD